MRPVFLTMTNEKRICCSWFHLLLDICESHETHSAYILMGKRVRVLYGPEIVVTCFKCQEYIILEIKLKNLVSSDFSITEIHVFTSFFKRESGIGTKCISVLFFVILGTIMTLMTEHKYNQYCDEH
jgi:hypothetical protein